MINHLGNVLTVFRDVLSGDATNGYWVDISSISDYSPFGVQLDGRTQSSGDYRFGFQGQESDDEIKGEGNSVNFKYRMHDPRVGRFFTRDPMENQFPDNSPFAFSKNQVIHLIELEGRETSVPRYVNMGDGTSTLIQAVDNTAVQKQQIMTLPAFSLTTKPAPAPVWNGPTMGPKKDDQYYRVELAKKNLDNYGQYIIPGGGIMNSLAQGKEITWTDLGVEAAGLIPIGKMFSAVGKAIAKSEFAEAGMRELANYMKDNAGKSTKTLIKGLQDGAKKHAKRIAQHKEYIANPKIKYGDKWDSMTDKHKANVIHHWKQDIKRHQAYKEVKENAAKEIAK